MVPSGRGGHGPNVVVGEVLASVEHPELLAVENADAALGAGPQPPLRILAQGIHQALRQAVGDGIFTQGQRLGSGPARSAGPAQASVSILS